MTERVRTKGTKEFVYTKEDDERIRKSDTPYTKAFKEAYREWINKPKFIRTFTKPPELKKHKKPIRETYSKGYKHKKVAPGQEPSPKPYVLRFKKRLLKKVGFIVVVILIILWAAFGNVTEEVTEEVRGTKTVTLEEPQKLSFLDYLNDVYGFDGKQETLIGFLERYVEGDGDIGRYDEAIRDDYGRRIDLIDLSIEDKNLFPRRGINKDAYQVQGTFKREYKTLKFKVKSIKKINREDLEKVRVQRTVSYVENITKNITRARFPPARAFILNLIGKEVLCYDNTSLGNCSDNKPYYCTYSGLIQDPTECGCPKDLILQDNKCKEKQIEEPLSRLEEEYFLEMIKGKMENATEKVKEVATDIKIAIEESKEEIAEAREKRNKRECQEAFITVNELRIKSKLSRMLWSDELYDVARIRAKDMYDRNYFSHYTPEGYDAGHYLGTPWGWSENIAEGYYSCEGAVGGWITSPGHHKNLLFGSYGAIAKYSNYYVYISIQ